MSISFEKWIKEKKNNKVERDTIKHQDLKKFLNDCQSLLFPGYIYIVENVLLIHF